MQPESRKYLWDALDAANAIVEFVEGKSWDEFAQSRVLGSAIERQFEVIGEALGLLAKSDPETARRIPNLRRAIDFRNVLIHGYASVDKTIVWRAIHQSLPQLRATLEALLREPPSM
ncbi:MAG: DUF86 domain-containing protein [Chloroflexi bacterium]|nr:DUF86 domain-containing protein [Chloroflexota bacterium]